MKILLSADWHVHGWASYSVFDDLGVPSRLSLFEIFSKDAIQLAKQRDCTVAIIAGDVLQTHSPKPMVSNTVRSMFDNLSKAGISTLVIPGNHDVDQKSGRFDPIHSGLAPILKGITNLIYTPEPQVVELRDVNGETVSVYCHPWIHGAPDYDNLEKQSGSPIFVGHGLVAGAVDPHSHIFSNGYDAKKLSKIFKLSVIGDIHSSQVITSTQHGRVLIPGQPLQINYSSDPNCGIWFYDTKTDELEFVPTTDFPSAKDYHFFYTTDGEIPEADGLVHYKKKIKKLEKSTNDATPTVTQIAKVDFLKLALNEFASFKPEYPELGEKLLRDTYESVRGLSVRSNIPTNQSLGKLVIDDFYSIGHFEIDLSDISGDILVVGNNGHGKSSFVEAVFWCLTGETTKKTPVTEISNFVTKKPARVSLEIKDGDSVAVVTRSRDTANLLTFEINGSNVSKASTSETQEMIYNHLGIQDADDILTLVYFSVKKNESFTSMVPSKQFEFLNRLVDSEQFEEFQRILSLDADHAAKEAAEIQLEIRVTQGILETTTKQRDSLSTTDYDNAVNAVIGKINDNYGTKLTTKEKALEKLIKITNVMKLQISECVTDVEVANAESQEREIKSRINELTRSLQRLTSSSLELVERYEEAASGVCPECKQSTHDESLASSILAKATEVGKEIKQTKVLIAQENEKLISSSQTLSNLREAVVTRRSYESELRVAGLFEKELSSLKVVDTEAQAAVLNDSINQLQEKIQSLEEDLKDITPKKDTLALIKSKMLVKNSSLVSAMVAGVYSTLVDTVNELVGDKNVFYAKAVVSGKKLETKVSYRGGKETSVSGISAGETRLLDALFMLALNTLFERRFGLYNGVLGIVFYDEILTYLDPEYTDIVVTALQGMNTKTRFMITHDTVLMSYYNRILKATKTKGLTQYERINF